MGAALDEAGAPAFDLLVIGGGINGSGIARDAAGRGLRVCLVEQDDLASHTSSASTKLIHGGLRYLEQHEFRLVREALSEREKLLAIAPHIIRPQRFILPYVQGLRPRWLLRLGLFVYDHAGGRERLSASHAVELKDNVLGAPLQPQIHTGFEYFDCWVDDARLVLLNALDASQRGALILTRTQLVEASPVAGGWRASLLDRLDGTSRTIGARAIVNAAGAWAGQVLGSRLGLRSTQRLRLVQGSHLIVRRLYDGDHAYLLQSPDNRVVFAIPYEGDYTLIGTTDQVFDGDPSLVKASAGEMQYLCDCVNRFFRRTLSPADVISSFSGVRALHDDDRGGSAQQVSRDYLLELESPRPGTFALSVFGGKITTYRRLAEAALERLLEPLGLGALEPWTEHVALPGGDIPGGDLAVFTRHAIERYPGLPTPLIQRLARSYGTRMTRILGDARQIGDLGEDLGGTLTRREVDYLIEEEWARSAEDILWRRSKLGLHGASAERLREILL